MEILSYALALFAVLALGLMTGVLLAEGAIVVPFWRSLPPKDFIAWYQQHAALLQNFFVPLEIAATVLIAIATVLNWVSNGAPSVRLLMATLLSIAVLAVFPIHFQKSNTSFATGTIAADRIPEELRRWSCWHWCRMAVSMAAFVLATVTP